MPTFSFLLSSSATRARMTLLSSSFWMRRQQGVEERPTRRAISATGMVASSCRQAENLAIGPVHGVTSNLRTSFPCTSAFEVLDSTLSVKSDHMSNIFPFEPFLRDCREARGGLALDLAPKIAASRLTDMIPIVVDPTQVAMALIGRGPAAERRLELLLAGGAQQIAVFSDAPSAPPGRAGGPSAAPPAAGRGRACALCARVDRRPADRRGRPPGARRQGRRLPRQCRGRRGVLRLPQSFAGAPRRPAADRVDRRQEPRPCRAHPRPAGPGRSAPSGPGGSSGSATSARPGGARRARSKSLRGSPTRPIDANGWLPNDVPSKDLRT